jgi:predicted RNA methylase
MIYSLGFSAHDYRLSQCRAVPGASSASSDGQEKIELDVPYEPSSEEVVRAMLEIATVDKNDLVYDLGCGDGRIVIAAVKKFGARGIGIDIDPFNLGEIHHQLGKPEKIFNQSCNIQRPLSSDSFEDV